MFMCVFERECVCVCVEERVCFCVCSRECLFVFEREREGIDCLNLHVVVLRSSHHPK